MIFLCFLFLVLLSFPGLSAARPLEDFQLVNISNSLPRRDNSGSIMDIHDGNTILWQGIYYYYGASYGLCEEPSGSNGCVDVKIGACGFRLDHSVALYTSSDLRHWDSHPHVFNFSTDHPIPGVMYCPKVLYNAQTSDWILWYNWLPAAAQPFFSESLYAVATANSPFGPFQVVNMNISLLYSNIGDFTLFLDDLDGSAYILYTSHITGSGLRHRMSVEKLTDDFLGSSCWVSPDGCNSGFIGSSGVEAPTMFRRGDFIYALFGPTCCYCGEGSPVTFYVASQPMGPYKTGYPLGSLQSQQTNVLPYLDGNGDFQYLWQGDRWQSAPDHLKGHDFSYWGTMSFNQDGSIQTMKFEDSCQISVLAANGTRNLFSRN